MIQMNIQWGHNDYEGWHSGPNSAGGVDVGFAIKNLGEKTIKYAGIFCIPYNAVGDAVTCDVSGKSEDGVKFTGPLAPGETAFNKLWSNAWYNHSITTVKVSKVELIYMDETTETIPGSMIANIEGLKKSGCYVATAVYGSYNCPQVWTLRRYRDYGLAQTRRGRAFIKTYYAISPTLVKWFGNTEWFKKMWRGKLDRMVYDLQKKGYEDTPYEDRKW
ncbi:MAG: hypothetical protein IJM20_03750 [Clostridia bacterium]|nr:hypothetical protein [Clostridia bacterium]